MPQDNSMSYRALFKAIVQHRSKLVLPEEQDAFIEHVEHCFENESGVSINDPKIEKGSYEQNLTKLLYVLSRSLEPQPRSPQQRFELICDSLIQNALDDTARASRADVAAIMSAFELAELRRQEKPSPQSTP